MVRFLIWVAVGFLALVAVAALVVGTERLSARVISGVAEVALAKEPL